MKEYHDISNEERLDIIKRAEKLFIEYHEETQKNFKNDWTRPKYGMCQFLDDVICAKYGINQWSLVDIESYIPVFTREFCCAKILATANKHWFWKQDEMQLRLHAFKKMRKYYEDLLKK
jgi:hypothetical protein